MAWKPYGKLGLPALQHPAQTANQQQQGSMTSWSLMLGLGMHLCPCPVRPHPS